ncbi:hypothetical protein VTP01DRAFT_7588 [Rhizomucor pusillus]|uniref:uncharacterized protein n=1 Tax=Rhizomucor pusillus TaxID=4840 RepID=UPI003742DE4E
MCLVCWTRAPLLRFNNRSSLIRKGTANLYTGWCSFPNSKSRHSNEYLPTRHHRENPEVWPFETCNSIWTIRTLFSITAEVYGKHASIDLHRESSGASSPFENRRNPGVFVGMISDADGKKPKNKLVFGFKHDEPSLHELGNYINRSSCQHRSRCLVHHLHSNGLTVALRRHIDKYCVCQLTVSRIPQYVPRFVREDFLVIRYLFLGSLNLILTNAISIFTGGDITLWKSVYRNAFRILNEPCTNNSKQPRIFVVLTHNRKIYFERLILVTDLVYIRTRKAELDVPFSPKGLKDAMQEMAKVFAWHNAVISSLDKIVLPRNCSLDTLAVPSTP